MNNIQRFISSIEVPNTEKVVKYVLGDLKEDIDHLKCNDLESLVLGFQPNSPKAITTICYILGIYAKWLQSEEMDDGSLLKEVQLIDKASLWKRAKPNAGRKFISYKQMLEVLHEIEVYEEYNSLYYSTLFRCIFEGVYNDDLSVIKNLRSSDISGRTLILREDNGHTYPLKVSEELASALKELASIDVWERKNRYGLCRIDMVGPHFDSVFKIEKRKNVKKAEEGSYRYSYYAKLRKIAENYVEYKLLPLTLFVSGIMYRVGNELRREGITLQEAFANNCRNKKVHKIIVDELTRCNYVIDAGNIRDMVKGHLDSFS